MVCSRQLIERLAPVLLLSFSSVAFLFAISSAGPSTHAQSHSCHVLLPFVCCAAGCVSLGGPRSLRGYCCATCEMPKDSAVGESTLASLVFSLLCRYTCLFLFACVCVYVCVRVVVRASLFGICKMERFDVLRYVSLFMCVYSRACRGNPPPTHPSLSHSFTFLFLCHHFVLHDCSMRNVCLFSMMIYVDLRVHVLLLFLFLISVALSHTLSRCAASIR